MEEKSPLENAGASAAAAARQGQASHLVCGPASLRLFTGDN